MKNKRHAPLVSLAKALIVCALFATFSLSAGCGQQKAPLKEYTDGFKQVTLIHTAGGPVTQSDGADMVYIIKKDGTGALTISVEDSIEGKKAPYITFNTDPGALAAIQSEAANIDFKNIDKRCSLPDTDSTLDASTTMIFYETETWDITWGGYGAEETNEEFLQLAEIIRSAVPQQSIDQLDTALKDYYA